MPHREGRQGLPHTNHAWHVQLQPHRCPQSILCHGTEPVSAAPEAAARGRAVTQPCCVVTRCCLTRLTTAFTTAL